MKTYQTTTSTDRLKASFSLLILISLFLPSQASTNPTEDLWVPPRAAQATQALSTDFKLSKRLHADAIQQRGRRQIQLDRLTEQQFRQKTAQTHKGRIKVGFDREIADFLTPAKTQDNLIWQTTPEGGLITLLSFSSPNALALRLGVSVWQLPPTAELRFFKDQNSDADVVTGSEILNLINRNLQAGDPEDTARLYWSPEQDGDAIGVEIYLQPGTSSRQVDIAIPKLAHRFLSSTSVTTGKPGYPPLISDGITLAAANCNIDVKCEPEWSARSNSVGQMNFIEGGGSWVCTGTLLNDTHSSGTPYFLSANHCISTQSAASSLSTKWFYYSTACNSGVTNPNYRTLSGGAELLYHSDLSDTSFMRLLGSPPAGVTYSGWTTSKQPLSVPSTGLHNPMGDLQKFSSGQVTGYYNCTPPDAQGRFNCSVSADGNYADITFSTGITEGGSSGSGIFLNSGQYLYGQLYGGDTSCTNPNGSNYYGRFDKSYSNGNLGQWLNSNSTTYTLNLTKTGAGSGRVTSSPSGINCGATCSSSFNEGTNIILTASTASGSVFGAWSGCNSSSANTCNVTMDAAKTITATFNVQVTHILSVSKTGSGTITSSPAGINCGTNCSASYTQNTAVVLTATPAEGYRFSGWDGACSGTGNCSLTMDQAKTVTANFIQQHTLSVSKTGEGTVTSSPVGINCGTICSAPFDQDTSVDLTATPDEGYRFSGWSGACAGNSSCSVTIDTAKTVSATFIRQYTLSASKIGEGTVTSSPDGINCGSACTVPFAQNTQVTLTATPAEGFRFSGWSGDCSGSINCAVTMDAAKTATATFIQQHTLSASKTGEGTVTSSPDGINCGSTCTVPFDQNTQVTLTETPAEGFRFSGWSGDCSGITNCSVTMDAARSVTATFSIPPQFLLTVTRPKSGVMTSNPAGIECGGPKRNCRTLFYTVMLTATPATGYEFVRWAKCPDPLGNTCSLTLTKKTGIKAVFRKLPKFSVTLKKNKLGSIESWPSGLSCPPKKTSCSARFIEGTEVTLKPIPSVEHIFAGWTGDCSGTEVCTLQMDGNKKLGALFQ